MLKRSTILRLSNFVYHTCSTSVNFTTFNRYLSMSSKAIVVKAVGQAAIENVPKPKLRDDHIIVKITAVALNPTDWKSAHAKSGELIGRRLGCDYAGTVEEIGTKVTNDLKKGDRVTGIIFGAGDDGTGAFGEYASAKGDLQIKIPENLSDEEAATLGVGISTVAQGLYQNLKLPLPTKPAPTPFPILIYGGSTATGILGIQFAKLSGLTVVATSSPHNFDYLKSLGADAVFDYKSPTCAEDIKKYTQGKLTHAWDCSPTPSARLCASAMSDTEPGQYGSLLGPFDDEVKTTNSKVSGSFTLAYSMFGEAFSRNGKHFDAKPEDYEFGKMFWELSRGLLAEGKVKVAKLEVNRGGSGLEGVLKGLDDLREGRVSGCKLVYKI